MPREIAKKHGRLVMPLGNGARYGISTPVYLVNVLDGEDNIVDSFFRVRWDGHEAKAKSRKALKAKVDEIHADNQGRQWWKFVIPTLCKEGKRDAVPYVRVVADACMVEAFEGATPAKRGTRQRHLDNENPGRYIAQSESALAGSWGGHIPDTVESRRQIRSIQRTLTRAVCDANLKVTRLREKLKGTAGDEYVGDR